VTRDLETEYRAHQSILQNPNCFSSLVVGMRGIDEPVISVRRENGGHQEQTMLPSLREFIPQSGELGGPQIRASLKAG
jgi:hypothetical protein